jgi:uncharacterized protein YceH (UPF0502 family)
VTKATSRIAELEQENAELKARLDRLLRLVEEKLDKQ